MARRVGRYLACAVAAGLVGCASAPQATLNTLLRRGESTRGDAKEKVFSVVWWAKADSTEGKPFRPIEPGSPDADPQSGTVFVGTGDGTVHALDRQGKRLWDFYANGPFSAGPAYANGRLYVPTSEGDLVVLDAANGAKLWSYDTNDELVTQPVVREGAVVVVSASDTVYVFDEQKGAWRWQYRREMPAQFTIRGAARPLVRDGRLYTGFADGSVMALDLRDGAILWQKELASGGQFRDADASPVMDDFGRLYVASFATGLFCLDPETGTTNWTVKWAGITTLAAPPNGGRVFAGGSGFLTAFDGSNGQRQWNLSLGGDRAITGLLLERGTLIAATGAGPLLFLDSKDGMLRRAFDPGQGVTAAPTSVTPGEALVLSNRGYVYNLELLGARK